MADDKTQPAEEPRSQLLYNRTPGRDAVYIIEIERAAGGLWQTFYSNGRRGQTLTKKPVTQPTDYAKAHKAYSDKLKAKLAGGYHPPEYFGETPAAGPSSYVTTDDERETGIYPQLLTEASDLEVVQLIADPAYGMEEKFDGHHVIIDVQGGAVRAINRKGKTRAVSAVVQAAVEAIAVQVGDFRVDGELLGDTYVIFDALSVAGRDLTGEPFIVRRAAFTAAYEQLPPAVTDSQLWYTADGKAAAFARLRARRAEGVVFKRLDAPYTPGRPNSGGPQRKFCFLAHASFVVVRQNTRRSFAVATWLDKNWVEVGNVTVPANKEMPDVGQIVDVRYKHAFRGGSLYQPFFLTVRHDIDLLDVQQQPALKYKPEGAEEDADG